MRSKPVQAVVLTAALVAGYAGAAAFAAWAQPAVPVATDFGPGDGLTRFVVTSATGTVSADLLGALNRTDGVVHAQDVGEGRALVSTDGLLPHHLEALPGVADADFSPVGTVLGTLTDPYQPLYGYNLDNTGSNAYNLPAQVDADVDAPEGWAGGTGEGMVIAIVDSGYDSDHVELAGALWTNPDEPCGSVDTNGNGLAGDCHGWNFATGTPDIDNGPGGTHGVSVAGVAGGRAGNGHGTAGVAPDVTLMPLVIGTGNTVDLVAGARAIRYAVDNGADVITASWGGLPTGWPKEYLRSAIEYAGDHGVLVVAAAGNDAADRDALPMYPASYDEPALVTVGNSDAADGMTASSAYGATSVDLFAPGDLVFTTWNDGSYRLVGGTSIAAPQVAAAYALYRAAMPDATAEELKQALLDDVDPVPAFAGRSVTGGRLSVGSLDPAEAAVRYTFSGMTAPAGPVVPGVAATGAAVSGEYAVTLGLGMLHEGEIWAVADEEVRLGDTTVTTDESGEARFDLGTAASPEDLDLSPTLDLGDGRYVLTVQLHRDLTAVGRAHAAPLLVGTAVPAPGDDDAGTGGPGGGSGSGSDGGSGSGSDGGSDGPGDGSDGGPEGGPDGGSEGPGAGSDGGSDGPGGGSDAGSGGGPGRADDGADEGSGDRADGGAGDGSGGGSGGGSDGGSDGSSGGGSDRGTDGADRDDTSDSGGDGPDDSGSGADPGTGVGPVPDDGGEASFPGTDAFRITGLSPTRVALGGGTLVTITGEALPSDARVRIGDAAPATVVSSSRTELVFRTPERVAGTYDVHVFARDGRTAVLDGALTYAADGVGGGGGDTGDGPGSDGGTDDGAGDGPGVDDDGGDAGAGDDGGEGSVTPAVRTGPGGERLVRNARFAALGAVWSLDCSTTCSGMAI